MASRVPIDVKMISWFAQAKPEDAQRQFAVIRAILADRGLLKRKGTAAKRSGRSVAMGATVGVSDAD